MGSRIKTQSLADEMCQIGNVMLCFTREKSIKNGPEQYSAVEILANQSSLRSMIHEGQRLYKQQDSLQHHEAIVKDTVSIQRLSLSLALYDTYLLRNVSNRVVLAYINKQETTNGGNTFLSWR